MFRPRKKISIKFFLFIVVLLSHLKLGNDQTILTTNPTWSGCPLIKASVIAVKTNDVGNINAGTTNTTTVTYSIAFLQTPRLTFGIRNIRRTLLLI